MKLEKKKEKNCVIQKEMSKKSKNEFTDHLRTENLYFISSSL